MSTTWQTAFNGVPLTVYDGLLSRHKTIAPGDPVIIIPIAQQKSYSPISFSHKNQLYKRYSHSHSPCYPTRFWEPVGPFFHATYDDYGRVALSKDQLNLYKLLFFIRSTIKALPLVHEGENSCHDTPLNLSSYLSEKTPELLAHLQTSTTFYAPPLELFDQASTVWDYIYEVAQEQRALELNFALHHLFQFGSCEGSSYPGEHSAIKDVIQLCQASPLSTDQLFDLVKP